MRGCFVFVQNYVRDAFNIIVKCKVQEEGGHIHCFCPHYFDTICNYLLLLFIYLIFFYFIFFSSCSSLKSFIYSFISFKIHYPQYPLNGGKNTSLYFLFTKFFTSFELTKELDVLSCSFNFISSFTICTCTRA